MTEYRLLLHRVSGELWAVRIEHDELTGVFGPMRETLARETLPDLPYDDDSDTAEWLIRYLEEFTAL